MCRIWMAGVAWVAISGCSGGAYDGMNGTMPNPPGSSTTRCLEVGDDFDLDIELPCGVGAPKSGDTQCRFDVVPSVAPGFQQATHYLTVTPLDPVDIFGNIPLVDQGKDIIETVRVHAKAPIANAQVKYQLRNCVFEATGGCPWALAATFNIVAAGRCP
jgi:hypothetical protein